MPQITMLNIPLKPNRYFGAIPPTTSTQSLGLKIVIVTMVTEPLAGPEPTCIQATACADADCMFSFAAGPNYPKPYRQPNQ